MNLKPYPEYKDSGVQWLGKVPKHWEIRKGKWLFNKIDRPVNPNDDVVTCFRDGVVTLRKKRRTTGFTEALKEIGYQGIKKGDLVIHQMDSFAGAVGVSDSDGKGTPVYSVCQPRLPLNNHYYANIVREMARSEFILSLAKGIRERSTDFRFDTFASLSLPLPAFNEQNKIAAFLNYKTAQLARFIKAKKRMIELLKEQKQVIINDAVTGKIDVATGKPYPKYKDSGMEWLGQAPEGWEGLPIKRLVKTKMSDGPHETPKFVDNGIPFVSAEAVYDGKVHIESRRGDISVELHFEFCKKVKPQRDDIFIVKSGSTTGKACIIDFDEEFSVWSPLALVRCNHKALPLFMFYAISSTYFQKQVQDRWSFGTQPNIGMGILQNLKILFPSDKRVQTQILESIETKTAAIDLTISRTEREIALIQEYRTRLISDVVTGKVDVRDIKIPDIADIDDTIDESIDELECEEGLEPAEGEE